MAKHAYSSPRFATALAEMAARQGLALIVPGRKRDEKVAFAVTHRDDPSIRSPVTTSTVGRGLEARPGSRLEALDGGPLGGDQRVGALIARGTGDALIFSVDPLAPMPHEVDVDARMRPAIVNDIPMALSRAAGEILLHYQKGGRNCGSKGTA